MATRDTAVQQPSSPAVNGPSSSSSRLSNRLPTVSASQALQTLKNERSKGISTGLTRLDALVGVAGSNDGSGVGLARGRVTELYGPPGVGKTTFGMQTCASALSAGEEVVWVDAATPLYTPRLQEILNSSPKNNPAATADCMKRFHYFATPTLAHLLALAVHPPLSFPPAGTSLIVLDTISFLFEISYPRNKHNKPHTTIKSGADTSRWSSSRRFAVMATLINSLSKMAAMHDIAVLILSPTSTKMRGGGLGALLAPAMAGLEWESSIATRIVLFRDWAPAVFSQGGGGSQSSQAISEAELQKIRFAGVVKSGGVNARSDDGAVGPVVPFTIETSGLTEVLLPSSSAVNANHTSLQVLTSPVRRSAKRAYDEVADSEGEDGSDAEYGWADDDDIAAEGLVDEGKLAT